VKGIHRQPCRFTRSSSSRQYILCAPDISSGRCLSFRFLGSHLYRPHRRRGKPNVVFFLADDLGTWTSAQTTQKRSTKRRTSTAWRPTACGSRPATPLARFVSPTRASIMTGKYPPRTGITNFIGGDRSGKLLPAPNQDHLALEEVTIAERLRDDGYTTFFAGKWHLGMGRYSPNARDSVPG